MNSLYVSKPYCWAPGIHGSSEWSEWKAGIRNIVRSEEAPELTFTSPIFRRRLSQISRMTVQTVHDIVEAEFSTEKMRNEIQQVFISLRGEIKREFSINEKLIKEGEVSPSAFSLSVFNTPIALAAIQCSLKAGYSVIFPSGQEFSAALKAACAPVLCGDRQDILLVYSDEFVPECYGNLRPEKNESLSFSILISGQKKNDRHRELSLQDFSVQSPSEFLRRLL